MEREIIDPSLFLLPLRDRDPNIKINYSVLAFKVDKISAALFLTEMRQNLVTTKLNYVMDITLNPWIEHFNQYYSTFRFLCLDYRYEEIRFYINSSAYTRDIIGYELALIHILRSKFNVRSVMTEGYINLFNEKKSCTHKKYNTNEIPKLSFVIKELESSINLNPNMYIN